MVFMFHAFKIQASKNLGGDGNGRENGVVDEGGSANTIAFDKEFLDVFASPSMWNALYFDQHSEFTLRKEGKRFCIYE